MFWNVDITLSCQPMYLQFSKVAPEVWNSRWTDKQNHSTQPKNRPFHGFSRIKIYSFFCSKNNCGYKIGNPLAANLNCSSCFGMWISLCHANHCMYSFQKSRRRSGIVVERTKKLTQLSQKIVHFMGFRKKKFILFFAQKTIVNTKLVILSHQIWAVAHVLECGYHFVKPTNVSTVFKSRAGGLEQSLIGQTKSLNLAKKPFILWVF